MTVLQRRSNIEQLVSLDQECPLELLWVSFGLWEVFVVQTKFLSIF